MIMHDIRTVTTGLGGTLPAEADPAVDQSP